VVRGLRVVWLACKDLFDEFFLLLVVNVLWSLFALPLLAICWFLLAQGFLIEALAVGALSIMPLAPASVALCAVANQVSEGIVSSWRVFWQGLRRYARRAWTVLGLWHLGLLLIVVDIWFYSGLGGLFGTALTVFWIYMLLVWLAFALYLPPLIVLSDDGTGARAIWRTAAAMTFGRPLFSLTVLSVAFVIAIIGLIVPLVMTLIAASLLALFGVRATRALQAEAEAAQEAATPVAEAQERGRRGQVRPRE
jgi:uncharacterized membrane protein YesL